MARLAARDRAEFEVVRSLCHAGLDSVTLRERLGHRMADLLGLDAFCYMELDPSSVVPTHSVGRGWSAETRTVLVEHVMPASRVTDTAVMHRRGLRTVPAHQLASDPRTDPYFTMLLAPQGYRHELLTLCELGGRPVALLTSTRRPQRGDFAARHVRFLDAVAPHIAAGIGRAILRETALADTDAETGVILLAPDGRLDYANVAGETWLRRGLGHSPAWHMVVRLVASLGSAVASDGGASPPATIETRDPDTGVLYRLHAERTREELSRTLILIEPVRTADRPGTLLQLGLTDQEARVTAALLQGYSTSAIGATAGCATETVRVHISHVFDKLGVRSRGELAAFLTGNRTATH